MPKSEAAAPVARLAKLTRPSAKGLIHRERLFKQLDDVADGGVLWISAAGGAGKTSLVSSWVDSRKHRALWFHFDEADSDPATFFHYLGLAGSGASRKRAPMPHLTPEYLLDVPTYD